MGKHKHSKKEKAKKQREEIQMLVAAGLHIEHLASDVNPFILLVPNDAEIVRRQGTIEQLHPTS